MDRGGRSVCRFRIPDPPSRRAYAGGRYHRIPLAAAFCLTKKPKRKNFSRWKDQVYTNKASIDDVDPIALPESLTSVKGNGATVITWVGKPIGKDEYVQAHLTYNGGVYDINNTQEGATFITLNFTNPASATKGTLFLSRVKKLPLQESNGDAGGKIDVSYVQNKEVTFE